MKTIVVGIDGSEQAARAVRWAAEEARAHHARLVVVAAWREPLPIDAGGMGVVPPDVSGEIEEGTRRMLSDQLTGIDMAGVEVEHRLVHEEPVDALLEAAADADLLVVGGREHGRLTTLFVGSVSDTLVHRAPCPVVIVR
jgi:nucleotide-binding universal stress UspA family protein